MPRRTVAGAAGMASNAARAAVARERVLALRERAREEVRGGLYTEVAQENRRMSARIESALAKGSGARLLAPLGGDSSASASAVQLLRQHERQLRARAAAREGRRRERQADVQAGNVELLVRLSGAQTEYAYASEALELRRRERRLKRNRDASRACAAAVRDAQELAEIGELIRQQDAAVPLDWGPEGVEKEEEEEQRWQHDEAMRLTEATMGTAAGGGSPLGPQSSLGGPAGRGAWRSMAGATPQQWRRRLDKGEAVLAAANAAAGLPQPARMEPVRALALAERRRRSGIYQQPAAEVRVFQAGRRLDGAATVVSFYERVLGGELAGSSSTMLIAAVYDQVSAREQRLVLGRAEVLAALGLALGGAVAEGPPAHQARTAAAAAAAQALLAPGARRELCEALTDRLRMFRLDGELRLVLEARPLVARRQAGEDADADAGKGARAGMDDAAASRPAPPASPARVSAPVAAVAGPGPAPVAELEQSPLVRARAVALQRIAVQTGQPYPDWDLAKGPVGVANIGTVAAGWRVFRKRGGNKPGKGAGTGAGPGTGCAGGLGAAAASPVASVTTSAGGLAGISRAGSSSSSGCSRATPGRQSRVQSPGEWNQSAASRRSFRRGRRAESRREQGDVSRRSSAAQAQAQAQAAAEATSATAADLQAAAAVAAAAAAATAAVAAREAELAEAGERNQASVALLVERVGVAARVHLGADGVLQVQVAPAQELDKLRERAADEIEDSEEKCGRAAVDSAPVSREAWEAQPAELGEKGDEHDDDDDGAASLLLSGSEVEALEWTDCTTALSPSGQVEVALETLRARPRLARLAWLLQEELLRHLAL